MSVEGPEGHVDATRDGSCGRSTGEETANPR
jgi:hypothetical protein